MIEVVVKSSTCLTMFRTWEPEILFYTGNSDLTCYLGWLADVSNRSVAIWGWWETMMIKHGLHKNAFFFVIFLAWGQARV